MIKNFVKAIKDKKSLRNLDNNFIEKLVQDYLKNNKKIRKRLFEHNKPLKSREFNVLLKDIRRKLHEIYGVFNLSSPSLVSLRKKLKGKKINEEAIKEHRKLLECHKSSKERIDDYGFIYNKIFSVTGTPKSVLDLACGLNPLSFPFMNLKKVDYFAYELSIKDCKFLNDYFSLMKRFGLNGKCTAIDLLHVGKLPKVDVCFLFKVLDSLEVLKKNYSYELFRKIKAKFIVVSFATKSICGINRLGRRNWFVKFLDKENYSYEIFETCNEKFYVIKGKN
jgi:16S rRNA (guanine(1405)-N(7))-methyltransferase